MDRFQHSRQVIAEFHDKYPLVGPLVWITSVQYFLAQAICVAAWSGSYSYRFNLISDLGNNSCGLYSSRYVCSPDHVLMNSSFIFLGITMAIGSVLIYHEFQRNRATFIGFGLMALAGLGTLLVGLVPENINSIIHGLGAVLSLLIGNISLVVLALALTRIHSALRLYTFLTGMFCICAFALFTLHIYLGIGEGGMERLASHPLTIWLVLFGIYMMNSHYNKKYKVSKN